MSEITKEKNATMINDSIVKVSHVAGS